MTPALLELLSELARFGKTNDASAERRSQKMLNITHDTGVYLALLIKAANSKNVLELGTSNGYSTLWLADAVGSGGRVTTIEQASDKVEMAEQNFLRSGLASRIQQVAQEAGDFLAMRSNDEYDFIFLDCDRGHYVSWWATLQRILAPRGLLVVDNAISHAHEIEDFRTAVLATAGYLSSLVPIGNGELTILKQPPE